MTGVLQGSVSTGFDGCAHGYVLKPHAGRRFYMPF
jgi:hypothetical protein